MSAKRRNRMALAGISLALLPLLLLACTAESPTAPEQTPAPVPTQGDNAWDITISVSPSKLLSTVNPADADPAIVTVEVRRKSNGNKPASGTTMVLSTTLGEFSAVGSGIQEVALILANGEAEAYFYPGTLPGTARLTARLEGSSRTKNVQIESQDSLFITGVVPNSGRESGGTRVTITGVGFSEPLQVFFADLPGFAPTVSKDGTSVKVDTPPVTVPDAFFNTEGCDSDGDGVDDGQAFIPTAVPVTVNLQEGPILTASLSNAFTYIPSDQSCRAAPPDPAPPFIQEVVPNRGPEAGGQIVEIVGRGFRQPLRIFIQDKLASVISVSNTRIVVTTPPGDMNVEACEVAGTPGTRDIPTPVRVEVQIIDGASESLENAYTYEPTDPTCQTG